MSRSFFAKLHRRFGPKLSGAELYDRAHAKQAEFSRWLGLASLPSDCGRALPNGVAIVGGGFAGLAAAWTLGQAGVASTVFEARKTYGGRVASDRTSLSPCRVIEAGAELIGFNHPMWIDLARRFGLGLSVLTGEDQYAAMGLEMPLRIGGKAVPDPEKLFKQMAFVLQKMSNDAKAISDPFAPWKTPGAAALDAKSVADKIADFVRLVPKSSGHPMLVEALELQLGNDNVLPTKEQSYLGLLALVSGGRLGPRDVNLSGYWEHNEDFRCSEGNDTLAGMMLEYGKRILFRPGSPVSKIEITETNPRVKMTWLDSARGYRTQDFDYAILTAPPSVWKKIAITPAIPPGREMALGPAVKYISHVDGRFWIKAGMAPSGASDELGQTWEPTENQALAARGVALSVFAGGAFVPKSDAVKHFRTQLQKLYPGYRMKAEYYVDWPNVPWIETGYACPKVGQVTTVGKELSVPHRKRLYFAGEHTCMAYFGYMEGALQSGARAAKTILASCAKKSESFTGQSTAAHEAQTERVATPGGPWNSNYSNHGSVAGICRGLPSAKWGAPGKGGLSEDFGAESDLKSEVSSDFADQVLAHPSEPDDMYDGGFGKSLVHSTDQAIASGKLRCSAELLRHLLSETHFLESKISTEIWDERPFSAAHLFDAFTSDKLPGLREYFTQFFEVVALPHSRIDNDLQPGDCLVRRALGEGNLAHLAMLVNGEVIRADELPLGLRPESWRPGLYAEVIDTGPFPHRLEDTFARRLGNENGGQLSDDSLILRIFGVDRPSAESEMAAFEYHVAELDSATEDYSLREIADGALGKLPDDILAAILTTGESDAKDLTNRVFWQKHRDLSGKTLDPKDPKQKALREEWGRIFRRQVKPIIWLRQIIDQLDRHRESIPREFLLGWIAAESDGKVSTVSTLGERGYFQIMWQGGEAKSQLGLTSDEFRRLSTDREFSIEKGVQLAKTYRQHFLRKYPLVPDGSDLLCRLTKGRHALPTALDKVLDRLVKAGTTITWQAVSQRLPKMASGVNLTLDFAAKLKPLADRIPAAAAATPEFYSESAPGFPGRKILRFEPGILQEQAPKCGFHGPNGEFVKEADLRAAVKTAALGERKIWWVGSGNTAQKEDNDARFGDLVRYWLAGRTGTIRPGKLEAVQKATLDPSVTYGNLGNATLNVAVQAFRKAAAEVDAKAADVYKKSDDVDLAIVKVEAAETKVKDAESAVTLAAANVKTAEKRVKDARGQSGSGAQAALDAERSAFRAATTELNAARKARDDEKKALREARTALEAAKQSHKQAKADRDKLEESAQKWKDKDRQKTREAILAKAKTGSTDPQKIDDLVDTALQLAHQSRADIEAWSAVFVVSCVRAAAIDHKLEAIDGRGAPGGEDGLLKASRRHSDYVVEARERKRGGTYHAFEPTKRAVQTGDIICTDRTDFIGKPALLKDVESGRLLHGDIVTEVKTEKGKPVFAETIGGNIEHTVRRRQYPLNDTGRLIVSATELFAMEDDKGAFGSLTPLTQVPTMLPPASTLRIFALLSLVEECKPASGIAPVGKSAPGGKQEWGRTIKSDFNDFGTREFKEDTPKSAPQPLRFKLNSKAITYNGTDTKPLSTEYLVYVPSALRTDKHIDVLVFFHGLDTCSCKHKFDPDLVVKIFRLDDQVEKAQRDRIRQLALVVPALYWGKATSSTIGSAWSAAHLNAFVDEVINQISKSSGEQRKLGQLILAGHSRAYAILTPLAGEFDKSSPETTQGSLQQLGEVWALDTTYGSDHAQAFKKWASKLQSASFTLVLSGLNDPNCTFEKDKEYPPIKHWVCAMKKGETLPKNLHVRKVCEGHCDLPERYIEILLSIKP